jgi:hypothetical protein
LLLSSEERGIIGDAFKNLNKEQQRAFFKDHNANFEYYAKNEQEFFVQSFSDYIMENKVEVAEMEPLLKRISRVLFNGIKALVGRGESRTLTEMKPLFEKILDGNKSTPLSEFAAKEPISFKKDIQGLFDRIAKEENTKAIDESDATPEDKALFATAPDKILEETPEGIPSLAPKNPKTLQQEILEAKENYKKEQELRGEEAPIEFPEEHEKVKNGLKKNPIILKFLKALRFFFTRILLSWLFSKPFILV